MLLGSIYTMCAMERLTCRALLTPRLRQLVGEQIADQNGRTRPPLNCRIQQLRCFTSAAHWPGQVAVAQEQQMRKFVELLLQQNKVMNLTAIKTSEEAWDRHVRDSLALLPILEECLGLDQRLKKLVDVGSGAGLPGLILALARPHWQVTLLDSLQKRCKFVEHAAASLGIDNVRVLCLRAEVAGQHPKHRGAYDVAVARAVAEMRILAELSLPLIRVGGYLVAAKGPTPQEEVQAAETALQLLGGSPAEVRRVESFAPEGQRTAVLIRKTSITPDAYPRKEGRPKKKPL